jgi:hypothetical protein
MRVDQMANFEEPSQTHFSLLAAIALRFERDGWMGLVLIWIINIVVIGDLKKGKQSGSSEDSRGDVYLILICFCDQALTFAFSSIIALPTCTLLSLGLFGQPRLRGCGG